MIENYCCFTGLRPQKLNFKENNEKNSIIMLKCEKYIIQLIERYNVTNFISGMALGWDIWCAEEILKLTFSSLTKRSKSILDSQQFSQKLIIILMCVIVKYLYIFRQIIRQHIFYIILITVFYCLLIIPALKIDHIKHTL